MAARPTALPRRDFLRSLGLAAGITAPDAVAPDAAATTAPTAPAEGAPTTSTPTTSPPATSTPTTSAPPEGSPPEGTAPEGDRPEGTAPAAADAVVPLTVSAADRHILSRFSYGISQKMLADLNGRSASTWFEDQLAPNTIADGFADSLRSWWPHLDWSPQKMWDEDQAEDMAGWLQQNDFLRWTLVRRIFTKRQVQETMAEFWSNLLYIPAPLNKAFPHRVGFDNVIRQHALGTFAEMLEAAILHPAMLCYLDNAKSTQKAVNENLGRELLELHTLGVGGYAEEEVADSARILTGWHVDTFETWDASYVPTDHSTQPVRVLDFEAVNGSPNGQQVARDYLQYLARHDKTAARIARRLAVRFVSDDPSDALVEHLAGVFKDSGTDIRTTLRALVAHPEFKASAGKKVRTPTEDAVNTFRILDVEFQPPTGNDDNEAAQAILYITGGMGQLPFEWPRPDGFPDAADAWSSASRALGSWRVHKNACQAAFPKLGAVYHPFSFWVPALPMRFDAMVNSLSLRLTAQPASAQTQRAATLATEVEPDEFVLATSSLVRFRMPDLLVALLDSPQHMMR